MKTCVLSGSPKGEYSITWQTVRYLEKRFPEDLFETLHVGQKIREAEKDIAPFLGAMKKADLILFCYPVYTFVVPYQLHRFIELLKKAEPDLKGKFCAQITTSKHFYDVTAHSFIMENASDLGLNYAGGLSADMDDLLTEKGRQEAAAFWKLVHFRAENRIFEPVPAVSPKEMQDYVPSGIVKDKLPGKETVIAASLEEGDSELAAMIEDFRNQFPYRTRLVNLNTYHFAGGCLGCFRCAAGGRCIYRDGFDEFLRAQIQTGSAIVYAFRIQDHSMGSRMKLFDDRQFCNGHRTVTAGMPVGYLVRGDLSAEPNLKMIMDARSQVGGNFPAGIAVDENGVKNLAASLAYAVENQVQLPANFYGVGGMKIFRDLIWLMRGMMKADHRFYKAHGLYDFPQKKHGMILKMKLAGALVSNPKIMKKIGNKMNEGMLAPYRKVLGEDVRV